MWAQLMLLTDHLLITNTKPRVKIQIRVYMGLKARRVSRKISRGKVVQGWFDHHVIHKIKWEMFPKIFLAL